MTAKVDEWFERLLRQPCALCGLPGRKPLCRACSADLPWILHACRRCGRPLPTGTGSGYCALCDLNLDGLMSCRAALVYEYPVDRLVVGAKFQHRPALAHALGSLLAGWLALRLAHDLRPDIIVPVPLHPAREAKRGFNQADAIARPVAGRLGLPLQRRSCRRCRATPAQSGLGGTERRRNLRDAFVCDGKSLRGLTVAVIDDVVTTGSTASALALALQGAGATRVDLWTAARVVPYPAVKV